MSIRTTLQQRRARRRATRAARAARHGRSTSDLGGWAAEDVLWAIFTFPFRLIGAVLRGLADAF